MKILLLLPLLLGFSVPAIAHNEFNRMQIISELTNPDDSSETAEEGEEGEGAVE